MKTTKIVSVFAGLTLLAASLVPMSASALSTASITMDAAYSTNGRFSVVVYEDTGSDSVTSANVVLTFNQPVSDVSYDYSVGQFTATSPSGAHYAYGAVTGKNPLARVSFTLANPGTVIADVDSSSYLKHAGDSGPESFIVNQGEAYFTYTAPEPKAAAAPKPVAAATAAPEAAATTAAPVDNPAALAPAKDESTKHAAADKPKSSRVGVLTSSVTALLVLGASAAYWFLIHNKHTEAAPAKAYKLDARTTASKNKPAKKKTKS